MVTVNLHNYFITSVLETRFDIYSMYNTIFKKCMTIYVVALDMHDRQYENEFLGLIKFHSRICTQHKFPITHYQSLYDSVTISRIKSDE